MQHKDKKDPRQRQMYDVRCLMLSIECKSQWQGHTKEPLPEGVHRGKSNSRAAYREQITTAGTHPREPPPEASIAARATAEPPIECKSQWQGNTKEPPPEGVHRGKSNSRASYRVQITMPKRAAARKRPSRQEQQQSRL